MGHTWASPRREGLLNQNIHISLTIPDQFFLQVLCCCHISLPRNSTRAQPVLDTQVKQRILRVHCFHVYKNLNLFSACLSSQVFHSPLSSPQHATLGYSLWWKWRVITFLRHPFLHREQAKQLTSTSPVNSENILMLFPVLHGTK